MARSVRVWLKDHPPSLWVRTLEVSLQMFNLMLALAGAGMLGWAIYTGVEMHQMTRAMSIPWFLYAFGVTGGITLASGCTALLGTCLRSAGCLSANVLLMCLVLTAQACMGVAYWVDRSWEQRLPPESEAVKRFIAQRLEVCKWVGVALFSAQLFTLLLSCALQSAYVHAQEAAEDAAEDNQWQRQPLLQSGTGQQQQAAAASRRALSPQLVPQRSPRNDSWSRRMQEQYGLDTSGFSYDPERQAAPMATVGATNTAAVVGRPDRSRACTIM